MSKLYIEKLGIPSGLSKGLANLFISYAVFKKTVYPEKENNVIATGSGVYGSKHL